LPPLPLPPRTPPPFPYTTLFRSDRMAVERDRARVEELDALQRGCERKRLGEEEALPARGAGGNRARDPAPVAGDFVAAVARCPEDRKSTRLNSSHLGISYAVFCL